MTYYETIPEKSRRYRARSRMKAVLKLANGKDPCCAICGCPHVETLHIGHPKHRDGRFHRKELNGKKGVISWINRTPIEEVLERVQLECPYCNAWHNKFKEYPPEDKRPCWNEELAEKHIAEAERLEGLVYQVLNGEREQ